MKILFPIFWALVVIGLIEVSNAATTRFDSVIANGSLSVGDTAAANSKAIVDLKSTTKGLLPPRMTTAQRDAITSPPTGLTVFNTSTNKLNAYNGTSWTEVGSGSGGTLNYIQQTTPGNYDAEINATTGWNTYDDGAATPVDGTGGSFGGTFAVTPSPALRGTYSFKYTPGTAGEGTSYDFTIDPADKGKMLQIEFDYSLSATITEGDYTVWIYDVTNATLTQPAPYKLSGTTGTNYKFQSEFQTASNSVSYRVLVHQATSPSAHIVFDNFKVGPANLTRGPPVTDWVSYTPTFTNISIGNGTVSGQYRRVGDSLEFRGKIIFGTTTSVSGSIGIATPTGFAIDTAKLAGATNAATIGYVTALDSGTNYRIGHLGLPTSNNLYAVSDAGGSNWGATVPFTWTTNDEFGWDIKVPITGWSSSLVMSSDADTRVVAAQYYVSASTANSSFADDVAEIVDFDTKVLDTHNAATTGAAWKYTAPVKGVYRIYSTLRWANATNLSDSDLILYKNGSQYQGALARVDSGSMGYDFRGSQILELNAGDYVQIYANQNDSAAGARTINTASRTYIYIEKLSGPAQVAASETVAARYSTAASTAISTTTSTNINFADKDYDTHGAVTTGAGVWKFTAPVAGFYLVSAYVGATAGTTAAGNVAQLNIAKNATTGETYQIGQTRISGTNYSGETNGSMTLYLLAGEYVSITFWHNATSMVLPTSAPRCWVSIIKVNK